MHAMAQLEQYNVELEQFTYVASHDLQEPLRSVSSCVQLLEKRYLGKLDARADGFIRHAAAACMHMREMLDGLLALSRVNTAGGQSMKTDTNEIVRQVTESMAHEIRSSDAHIDFGTLPVVQGYPHMLVNLFQNLIANALKFNRSTSPEILIRAERENDFWIFSVSDNGIGIDPQHCDRIFRLFQRLHPQDEYLGNGLGLAICKRIVEHHGGKIWVESALGHGSTFFFSLPAIIPKTSLLLKGAEHPALLAPTLFPSNHPRKDQMAGSTA